MCDEHRITDKAQKTIRYFTKFWCILNHVIRYSGEHRDKERDRSFRINKSVKLLDDLAVLDAIGPDLGDTAWRSFGSSRFEIEDNKTGVRQRDRMMIRLDERHIVAAHAEPRVARHEVRDEKPR